MACSSPPMLLIEVNVSGWRSPSVSLHACSASSHSGLASSSWPMACSSRPILLIEASVSGWRSPNVPLRANSDSSYSGLASSSLPMPCSQRVRVAVAQRLPQRLQRLLVQRPRLLQLAHFLQQPAHVADRGQCARVAVAQRLPARLQRLLVQRPRLLQLAHALQQDSHVADRGQRVRVAVSQRLPARLQILLAQRPRLLQLAHGPQQAAQVVDQRRRPPLGRRQPSQRRPRLSDQRLAQQADDLLVALDEAHALLQLIQNGLGVFGLHALSGAHVHLGQARLDRAEVIDERRIERGLLRRGHHHVELGAARLRVVDLLDAVGALERCGRVPRLQQQHRAPDGAHAVAQPLDIVVRRCELPRGLPDHVVAHPELGVEWQLLLPQELAQRVDQRRQRGIEEPAHEHGGLAHVRRPLLLQPLAHGQPVHLGRLGDVELVGVAVIFGVGRELGRTLRVLGDGVIALLDRRDGSNFRLASHGLARASSIWPAVGTARLGAAASVLSSSAAVGTDRAGAAASGSSCSGTGSSLARSGVRTTGGSAISTCAAQGRHARTALWEAPHLSDSSEGAVPRASCVVQHRSADRGTPAPLSVRPPEEKLCSLLSQHPMFTRRAVAELGIYAFGQETRFTVHCCKGRKFTIGFFTASYA
eukprot:scaffold48360_cov60-Phaeocystis_antarctica.AAC.2